MRPLLITLLVGCAAHSGGAPASAPAAAPPPAASAPAAAPSAAATAAEEAPPRLEQSDELIEAGCSFNAGQILGEVGSRHLVSCPRFCEDEGGLWGTDVYTADSWVCRAAIHAGYLTRDGGMIVVIIEPGRRSYAASTRNGVTSKDFGPYDRSYRLERP
jgi:hypothetical protein